MRGFRKLSVHHINVDDVEIFVSCKVGTNTEVVLMPNPKTSGANEKDDITTSLVSYNRMKTGMTFGDIVQGNYPPNSVARVNLDIPDQKKPVAHKKQVARFTNAR